MTPARYARLVVLPYYQANLDVVAVAPTGEFAAFCLGWFDPVSRSGLLEPVGTVPAFRGLGLGRAVVAEVLRRLRAMGCERVAVVTGDDNEPAMRLYHSCGFRLDRRDYHYQRE